MRKAQEFYNRKKHSKLQSSKQSDTLAIAMDYSKNISVPNITSNDAYYKRQLSVFLFNIHVLASGKSCFYVYDETVARKGSNEVCSLLNKFVAEVVPQTVKHLIIFCDSCGGQNKNYTILRFLYYLVHTAKRFEKVTVNYPIRGHSYLECDKNFALLDQKFPAAVPGDWVTALTSARKSPEPFQVTHCAQEVFWDFTSFLSGQFKPKCPIPVQKVKVFKVEKGCQRQFQHRESYHGPWVNSVAVGPQKAQQSVLRLQHLYTQLIPLKLEKYNDLQTLKHSVDHRHHGYFAQLPCVTAKATEEDEDFST